MVFCKVRGHERNVFPSLCILHFMTKTFFHFFSFHIHLSKPEVHLRYHSGNNKRISSTCMF